MEIRNKFNNYLAYRDSTTAYELFTGTIGLIGDLGCKRQPAQRSSLITPLYNRYYIGLSALYGESHHIQHLSFFWFSSFGVWRTGNKYHYVNG
jgi:hypothetical protein